MKNAKPIGIDFGQAEDAVVIRRMGCRDERTKRIFRAALLVMSDDVTLVAFPDCDSAQYYDDNGLLRLLADIRNDGGNATLEEIFYFIEMRCLAVVIDDKPYTHTEMRKNIFAINHASMNKVDETEDPSPEHVMTDSVPEKVVVTA